MARERKTSLAAFTAGFPTSILSARKVLDILFNASSPAATEAAVDETIDPGGVVPDSGLVELDNAPIDLNALIIATSPGASVTEFSITTSADTLASGTVRVNYRFPERIDFSTDDAGTAVYFSYNTKGTVITAGLLGWLWSELRAVMEYLVGPTGINALSAVAGEDLAEGDLLYLKEADGKFWKADPSDPTTFAVAMADADYSTGETATGLTEALVTPSPAPPGQKIVYAGRGARPTWDGENGGHQLMRGDMMQPIGVMEGSTLRLNLKAPVLWEKYT